MAKFEVLANEFEYEGVTYTKGQAVETSSNLAVLFPNRFKALDAQQPSKPAKTASKQATKKAPVKGTPKKPEVDSQPDTAAGSSDDQTDVDDDDSSGDSSVADDSPEDSGPDARGNDVTAAYPKAVEQDFLVFENDGGYFVYDADDPKTSLRKKGVKKTQVNAVIKKALGD